MTCMNINTNNNGTKLNIFFLQKMRKRVNKKIPTETIVEVPPSEITAKNSSCLSLLEKTFNYFYFYHPPCKNVLTSNTEETWNARCFAPATIVLELQSGPKRIACIELMPDMLPETGMVRHVITLKNTTDTNHSNNSSSYCFCGIASNRCWIRIATQAEANDDNNINNIFNRIEVTTTLSPSWVAWRQIKIMIMI